MAKLFDAYLMVDWSAANVPRLGRDSIWTCWRDRAGTRVQNHPTRAGACDAIATELRRAVGQGRRVLAGFDFPFGYPVGFARRLGIGGTPWRATWDLLAALVEDDAANRNNRFAVGAELNRRLGAPMFWGCPAGAACADLPATRPPVGGELAERRLIDRRVPRVQPVWKLFYTGSAGGQALLGIPRVAQLRATIPGACVWPFETGLRALDRHDGCSAVLAEIYPSLLKPPDGPEVKDARQVVGVTDWLRRLDAAGALAALFAGGGLPECDRLSVEAEESWILGVA